jgi:hypothetical protein
MNNSIHLYGIPRALKCIGLGDGTHLVVNHSQDESAEQLQTVIPLVGFRGVRVSAQQQAVCTGDDTQVGATVLCMQAKIVLLKYTVLVCEVLKDCTKLQYLQAWHKARLLNDLE